MPLNLLKRSEKSAGSANNLTASEHDANFTAIENEVDAKAPLASPALTGTPTAPTAAVGTNTTQVATCAFVRAENSRVAVKKAGTTIGTRRAVNFIEGSNVTITVADDSGNEEVDVTIASSGGGGGGRATSRNVSANASITTSDHNVPVRLTSSGLTITVDTVANLADDFTCDIWNVSSGNNTVNMPGSASVVMLPNDVLSLKVTGVNLWYIRAAASRTA